MDQELQAILDAWDKDSGRDEDMTRELSRGYVKAHAAEFNGWDALSQETLVREIDTRREQGDLAGVAKIQAWLWHHFPPQTIGASADATVRTV